MDRNIIRASVLVAFVFTTPAAGASSYYLSERGLDSNDGLSTSTPFLTLAKAQLAMRSSQITTTIVLAGTYSIASGLQFASPDSGQSWLAARGEPVILDGHGTGRIDIKKASHLTFEGFQFQNMSEGGLYVDTVSFLTLRWNTFLNSKHSAISGYVLTDSLIDSNTVDGQFPGTISGPGSTPYWAIELGIGSNNNKITHNLIENCQGGGIRFGAGENDPPNNDNTIERNLLRYINTDSSDSGAIYSYDPAGRGKGLTIANNVIKGNGDGTLHDHTVAIYLDATTSHATVVGNTCRACGQWAWQMNWGSHNRIQNNIFDLSTPGSLLGIYQDFTGPHHMTGNLFTMNIISFGDAAPQSLYTVDLLPDDELITSANNLYYSRAGVVIPNGPQIIDSSPVHLDSAFTSSYGGDYSTLLASPAAIRLGFSPAVADQGPLPMPDLLPNSAGLIPGSH